MTLLSKIMRLNYDQLTICQSNKSNMIQEFKKFISQGSVIDLAIGIIIGAAFGKIVSSFVGDVIMPPIGMLLSGVDFSQLGIVLKEAAGGSPAVIISYGKFIQTIIDFIIIALAIFLVIKAINNFREKKEEAAPAPTKEEVLLAEIRDLLKADIK